MRSSKIDLSYLKNVGIAKYKNPKKIVKIGIWKNRNLLPLNLIFFAKLEKLKFFFILSK